MLRDVPRCYRGNSSVNDAPQRFKCHICERMVVWPTRKVFNLTAIYNETHLGRDAFRGSEWYCDSFSLDYTRLKYLLGVCLKNRSTISTLSWTWFEQWRPLVFCTRDCELSLDEMKQRVKETLKLPEKKSTWTAKEVRLCRSGWARTVELKLETINFSHE